MSCYSLKLIQTSRNAGAIPHPDFKVDNHLNFLYYIYVSRSKLSFSDFAFYFWNVYWKYQDLCLQGREEITLWQNGPRICPSWRREQRPKEMAQPFLISLIDTVLVGLESIHKFLNSFLCYIEAWKVIIIFTFLNHIIYTQAYVEPVPLCIMGNWWNLPHA